MLARDNCPVLAIKMNLARTLGHCPHPLPSPCGFPSFPVNHIIPTLQRHWTYTPPSSSRPPHLFSSHTRSYRPRVYAQPACRGCRTPTACAISRYPTTRRVLQVTTSSVASEGRPTSSRKHSTRSGAVNASCSRYNGSATAGSIFSRRPVKCGQKLLRTPPPRLRISN